MPHQPLGWWFCRCWTPLTKQSSLWNYEECSVKPLPRKDSNTWRYEAILSILTSNHLAPVALQNISGLFVPLAAKLCLHCKRTAPGFEWNRAEARQSWLICFFFHIRVRLLCSHRSKHTELKGKCPLFQNNISGVKAWGTFKLFFSCAVYFISISQTWSNLAMKLSV